MCRFYEIFKLYTKCDIFRPCASFLLESTKYSLYRMRGKREVHPRTVHEDPEGSRGRPLGVLFL